MNMKIMIICPSMYPNMRNWGETQRMYYLANYLTKNGCEVLTISPWFDDKGTEERLQLYKSFFLGEKSKVVKSDKMVNSKENLARRIRHKLAQIANFLSEKITGETPFVEVLKKRRWIRKYKRQICEFICNNDIDIVIISAPSFSLLSLCKAIKKYRYNIKLVFDYRDPWYLWKGNNFSYFSEKKYLKRADAMVGFSKAFTDDMIEKYHLEKIPTQTVYNGYSAESWEHFLEKNNFYNHQNKKMVITYTGMIYLADRKDNYRNLARLIDIVNSLNKVELYLVGVVGQKEAEIKGNVHYIGNVSQEESFRYMMNSDVLLSIHDTNDNSQKYIVSGKFYDYVKSGKYLFHIGAKDSLMCKMIEENGLGMSCRNESEELESTIKNMILQWGNGTLERNHNEEFVSFFDRDFQNEKYLHFLEKL